jgi:hypothetical protein
MAMRNPGATLLLVVAPLVGAMVAAGIGDHRAMAADRGISSSFVMDLADEALPPMFPGDPPSDEIGPAPLTDVAPLEDAGYFDTGPVEDDLAGTTIEAATAGDDLSQSDRATADESPADTSPGADSQDSYRFEYPDEPYGDAAQPADEADDRHEDTDDEYDDSEYEYGYDFAEQYQGDYAYDDEDEDELEDAYDDAYDDADQYEEEDAYDDENEDTYDYANEYEDEDAYEYEDEEAYDYEDEYEYDFEAEYAGHRSDAAEEAQPAADESETGNVDEVDDSYDSYDEDQWESEYDAYQYDYEDEFMEDELLYEDEPDDDLEPSEYEDRVPRYEAEIDGQLEEEPGEGLESDGQEPYGYDWIDAEYEYYEYEFYGEDTQPVTVADDKSEADGSESAEADGGATWQPECQDMPPSGLELFARHPAELLVAEDQQVLQALAAKWEESPSARRAAFHNYLEGLGLEAIDFSSRFEEVTGIEVLGLADDLPGAAAFLGAFRLAEQGELGMNEAVNLSERSLKRLSWSWIQGVDQITAEGLEDRYGPQDEAEVGVSDWSGATAIENPVVDVMVSLASRSVAGVSGSVRSVARRLAELDWPSLSPAPVEGQAASHINSREESIQR